jgi:hypothetical protein
VEKTPSKFSEVVWKIGELRYTNSLTSHTAAHVCNRYYISGKVQTNRDQKACRCRQVTVANILPPTSVQCSTYINYYHHLKIVRIKIRSARYN